MYGICHLSCVPLRKEPVSTSEMLSQLIYGESFTVIEETKDWFRIRTEFDNYEGWINRWQARYSNESFPARPFIVRDLYSELKDPRLILPAGSMLGEPLGASYAVDEIQPDRQAILNTALQFLGSPYLWGGRSFMGIDCSGLSQVVYKVNGIHLLRDAKDQATQGHTLSFLTEAKAGDLAFFDNDEGRIIHVGILDGQGSIVHAYAEVRVDQIDQQGIFNTDQKKHTHKLRLIKSFL